MEDKTIGVTGKIGSGKSVVSRVLRCNGFRVYDCDAEAKSIMTLNSIVKTSIQKKLGKNIYNSNGDLNRKLLASIIFSNEEIRCFINSIVHKAVKEDILRKRKEIKGLFFIESAILATGGLTDLCNQVWWISSPQKLIINRICKRDNFTLEEIDKRIKSQEKEFDVIKQKKDCIILINDEHHPILGDILKMVGKYNNKSYFLSC